MKSRQGKKDIRFEIEIPGGVEASVNKGLVTVKGPKGENKRDFFHKKVSVVKEGNSVFIISKRSTRREKKVVGSFNAHIKNMFGGVLEPHVYKLKICSGHFPMTVTSGNKQLTVKNMLGEKIPRVLDLVDGVNVKVEGDIIVVESTDMEKAGQCAASIERLTRRAGFDLRVFQDGCWIVSKAGKEQK